MENKPADFEAVFYNGNIIGFIDFFTLDFFSKKFNLISTQHLGGRE